MDVFLFQAVGLLIGIEEVSPEKQVQCLTALLNPLCHQVSVPLLPNMIASLGKKKLTVVSENQFQIESLVVGAKAQGLEELSPRARSLQQIVVALNMLTKVCFVHLIRNEQ